MLIRELTFLATGEILTDERFDTAVLTREALDHHERWWRTADTRTETTVDTPAGPLRVKFTFGAEGRALATWWLSEVPVLSSLLVAGIHPGEDAALTTIFRESMRNIKHVRQPGDGEAPFVRMAEERERPLAAGVYWPFTPLEHYRQVVPTIRLMTAAFFRARPTGGE